MSHDEQQLRAEVTLLRDELDGIFRELMRLEGIDGDEPPEAWPAWLTPLGSVVTLASSLLGLPEVDEESFVFCATAIVSLNDATTKLGEDFHPTLRVHLERRADLAARWRAVSRRATRGLRAAEP